MQTQLGLGGLSPGVASAAPLPARLRLSPVSTRKSEQAPLSSWSIVCGAHGRESDAWWSIPYLIVPLPRSRSPANRRTPARHRGRGDSWLPLQRPCIRGLAIPHSTHRIPQAERKREDMGWEGEGRGGRVDRVSVSVVCFSSVAVVGSGGGWGSSCE